VPAGGGQSGVRFQLLVEASGLARGADALVAEAFWHDDAGREVDWHPLFREEPVVTGDQLHLRFAADLVVPAAAAELRVRCGLRWAAAGQARWHGWRIEPAVPPAPRPLRLGVASARPPRWQDMATNAAHYLDLCRQAARAGVQLLCLPELILTHGMPQKTPQTVYDAALPIPGDWLLPWQEVASAHRMALCFSVYEKAGRHGETVYNTAILIGQDGTLIGRYRKVHLALREARNGIAAGHDLPVFTLPTDSAGPVRVGMAICMDSTPLETARVLAVQGAELLLTPINGDFRALGVDVWGKGDFTFHEGRWQAIQRAHALDNHLYAVTARNATAGSAVTAPWGEILAYDDGSQGLVWADVDLARRPAHSLGASIHAVVHTMRRPYVYGPLTAVAGRR
jgi:predicted amidohydrolase